MSDAAPPVDARRQEALLTLLLHGDSVARLWDGGAYGATLGAGGSDLDQVLQDLLMGLIGQTAARASAPETR